MSERPKVGFGVMLLKDNKVLLGRRHDDAEKADSDLHGEGTWTFPGGKLDYKEKLIDGVKREMEEETGIKLNKADIMSVSDEIVHDNHYVTLGFLGTDFEGEAKALEPEEILKWEWFSLNELPSNIFKPTKTMIENYLKKRIYNEKN